MTEMDFIVEQDVLGNIFTWEGDEFFLNLVRGQYTLSEYAALGHRIANPTAVYYYRGIRPVVGNYNTLSGAVTMGEALKRRFNLILTHHGDEWVVGQDGAEVVRDSDPRSACLNAVKRLTGRLR